MRSAEPGSAISRRNGSPCHDTSPFDMTMTIFIKCSCTRSRMRLRDRQRVTVRSGSESRANSAMSAVDCWTVVPRPNSHPGWERARADTSISGTDNPRARSHAEPARKGFTARTLSSGKNGTESADQVPTEASAARSSAPRPDSISLTMSSESACCGVTQVTSSASCRGSQVPVTGTTNTSETACCRSST